MKHCTNNRAKEPQILAKKRHISCKKWGLSYAVEVQIDFTKKTREKSNGSPKFRHVLVKFDQFNQQGSPDIPEDFTWNWRLKFRFYGSQETFKNPIFPMKIVILSVWKLLQKDTIIPVEFRKQLTADRRTQIFPWKLWNPCKFVGPWNLWNGCKFVGVSN